MQSLIPPFDAYKGAAPYVFVSYAHLNSDTVYAHITRLHNEGFRIWYDEGIDPGADWSDEIAAALTEAAVFLVFISEAAVASNNVRKEIVFAVGQKKYMVCVHIEETDLPSGLKMQLGDIQGLLENRFHDKEKFYDRLFNALLPESTRGEERDALPIKDVPRKVKLAAGTGTSFWARHKTLLLGFLITVLLGLAGLGVFSYMQRSGSTMSFADKNLETALREEMQKPRGAIGENDLISFKGRIDLSGKGITDISPLRLMTGLNMINLEDNKITDVSPLANLEGVMVLGLGNNQISDLTPLQGMKRSLVGLSLAGNPIRDLKQLRPLANLEVLDLSGVPITDLEMGKYLRKLKSLVLADTGHGLDSDALRRFKTDMPPNCEIKIETPGGKGQ
ncbi:TIR domain-containing protein [Desulfovibrio sp. OttesenSCG-928-M16]|nr:TIR domain-containing protein [Desulfovibrio sp. OttesenSCG-928-M16]